MTDYSSHALRPLLLAAALFGASTPAMAQSLTGNVGSARITAQERAVEARFGFNDAGEAAGRVHYDYAFNDWWQLRTIAALEKPDDRSWRYDALTFENWFQWRKEADDGAGFNGGVRLGYTFNEGGGPDEAEFRLTVTDVFAGRWEWRANAIGEIETGPGSEGGVSLESRAQVTRGFKNRVLGAKGWRVGAEVFSEYGDTRNLAALEKQIHQAGPVLKATWDNGVYLQTAVRFGLTDETDDTMGKLFIGRAF